MIFVIVFSKGLVIGQIRILVELSVYESVAWNKNV